MPKSENQKLNILYVAKYLLENSDENRYVRVTDIVDHLVTKCDVSAERRSIYRDINIFMFSVVMFFSLHHDRNTLKTRT